jgi:hypothetical protein
MQEGLGHCLFMSSSLLIGGPKTGKYWTHWRSFLGKEYLVGLTNIAF